MIQHTSTSMGVHLSEGAEVSARARLWGRQEGHGPYASLTLDLGGFSLTVYPRGNTAELAEVLATVGAELRAVAEELQAQRQPSA